LATDDGQVSAQTAAAAPDARAFDPAGNRVDARFDPGSPHHRADASAADDAALGTDAALDRAEVDAAGLDAAAVDAAGFDAAGFDAAGFAALGAAARDGCASGPTDEARSLRRAREDRRRGHGRDLPRPCA
jgi:hypothetical protein